MLVYSEKQNGEYKRYNQLPLTARPLDLVYFLFFAIHLIASLLVDCQPLYPPALIPPLLKSGLQYYLDLSRDPLVGGMVGIFGDNSHLTWFKTFVVLEAIFQIPVFILGLKHLKKGNIKIYPLLMLYGASSATTTLACVTTILQTPLTTPETLLRNTASITSEQRLLLLSSYIPFIVIPFVMAVDMAMRVSKLINKAIKDEKWE